MDDAVQFVKHYRPSEAVALTGISRSTLYDLMKSGKLRSTKVGGIRLISESALAELLASGEGR